MHYILVKLCEKLSLAIENALGVNAIALKVVRKPVYWVLQAWESTWGRGPVVVWRWKLGETVAFLPRAIANARKAREGSKLRSCQCTQRQLESDSFQSWLARMKEPSQMKRKAWEWCYIAQALYENGMLAPERRGLGFAVGQEPLPALFASLGCEIMATDLATNEAQGLGWVKTAQHADSLDALNRLGICDHNLFREKTKFRFVDMRDLPDGLGAYDFIWSSCSIEHLGTISLGEQFLYDSLKYLKKGGISVHTTEYNLQSNYFTTASGPTVIFRRRDLKRIANNLRRRGCSVDLDFTGGLLPYDRVVDIPPYERDVHLKLVLGSYVVTSFGLVIRNG